MSSATDILTRKPNNTAIETTPDHQLNVVDTDIPELKPHECLVHVRATGICGSDVHFWKEGSIGRSQIKEPLILGHESAGTIIAIGSHVTTHHPGTRVAIEAGIPCSQPTCPPCRTGRYNACPAVTFHSSPPVHGTLRRYHAHDAAWLHALPPSVSYEEGALLEPLSVALAGLERAGLKLGDPVVVCGAGPIGMVALLAAHAAGAAPIAITDLDENRLGFAKKLVPRVRTVRVEKGERPEGSAERIVEALGQRAKVSLECTGVEGSVQSAIYASDFGAMVFIIGVGANYQQIPFMYCNEREIDIKFQYRYRETYPKAITLVSEGLIDLKPLVTHRFSLEQGKEAFKAASTPAARAVKVQVLDD